MTSADNPADCADAPADGVAYPSWLASDEERRRFDLAVGIATEVLDEPPHSAAVWAAARVIFKSDVPTA